MSSSFPGKGTLAGMDEKAAVVSNEQAQRTTRWIAAVLFAIGLVIAYAVWPAGVVDQPLGAVTFGALLRSIGAVIVVLGALFVAAMLWIE